MRRMHEGKRREERRTEERLREREKLTQRPRAAPFPTHANRFRLECRVRRRAKAWNLATDEEGKGVLQSYTNESIEVGHRIRQKELCLTPKPGKRGYCATDEERRLRTPRSDENMDRR